MTSAGGWVGPTLNLDMVMKRKIPAPAKSGTLDCPVHRQSLYWVSYYSLQKMVDNEQNHMAAICKMWNYIASTAIHVTMKTHDKWYTK